MQTLPPIQFQSLALVLVTSVAGPLVPGRQDAAELLTAQRAGLGDPAALARLGIVQTRGKMAFEGFPGEGTYTQILGAQGEARLEGIFQGIPPALRCTNRKLYWMTGTGGIEFKKGWNAAADVRLFAIARHGDWRDVYAKAELVGEAEVAGRACHELRMVPKNPRDLGLEVDAAEQAPPPDTWWLDRGSHELVRVAIDATVSGAGWQRLVFDYADWRPVSGVRFPYRSRMAFGPADHPLAIAFEMESVAVDVKFIVDPFQPDEQVLAALAKSQSGDAAKDPGFALQQRQELQTATIRVQCKPEELAQELATILPEVMGYLNREGITPAGVPFARYHRFGDEIDLEAGMPVAKKFEGNGRVQSSTLPGGDAVSGMHLGPYHELSRTHGALGEWLAKQGLTAEGGPWEIYWTDPGLERDPAKWRTEIVQPVSRK